MSGKVKKMRTEHLIRFKNNKLIIMISGFIWGISGFIVEFLPSEEGIYPFLIRSIFVVIGNSLIIFTIPFRISKKYFVTIILFLIYLIMFIQSLVVNNLGITSLFRELLLLLSVISIILLLNRSTNTNHFFIGLWGSLTLTIIFYIINIDLSMFLNFLYRFHTVTNPNVIGSTAAMYFILSLYFLYKTKNKPIQFFLLLFILISVIIVIATKSRTSFMMVFFSFFTLTFLFNKRKIILFSLTSIILIVLLNFNTIDNILRITQRTHVVKDKTILNLTGRSEIWSKGIKMIEENFYFGVGPEYAKVKTDAGYKHLHNAFIQLMANVGFIGSIPILILTLTALAKLRFYKANIFMSVVMITGFIGSLTEPRLLNYGLPSNLLFLISFIYMSRT